MLFHTPEFMSLMALTLMFYYFLPKSRKPILAVANILFYGATGIGYLGLFILVATLTYFSSLKLQDKLKRFYLWFAVGINILNLVFFKYALFILMNIERFFSLNLVIENTIFSKVILPIGISFYTFQMIAYLVDVYQDKIEPCKSWIDYWVFISFFAQLVAGPIMRGKDLVPQVEALEKIKFSLGSFKLGITYLSLGLFKKIILADNIAAYADNFFIRGAALSGAEAWIAAYLFAFQIYFDFSAYSEMAVGVGHLFGIRLDLNFKTPYLSANGTEFWKRWHITLSNWIKDYIYIPLGGSRLGELRQSLNLFLAMTISGLWHGAAWTFVAWGMFHGILLILHKSYIGFKNKVGLGFIDNYKIYHYLSIFIFFQLTCIGWVFFRVKGMGNAVNLVVKMLTFNPLLIDKGLVKYLLVILMLCILHIVEYLLRKNYLQLALIWHKYFPAPIRGLGYTFFIIILVIFLQGEQNSFIYFQF